MTNETELQSRILRRLRKYRRWNTRFEIIHCLNNVRAADLEPALDGLVAAGTIEKKVTMRANDAGEKDARTKTIHYRVASHGTSSKRGDGTAGGSRVRSTPAPA